MGRLERANLSLFLPCVERNTHTASFLEFSRKSTRLDRDIKRETYRVHNETITITTRRMKPFREFIVCSSKARRFLFSPRLLLCNCTRVYSHEMKMLNVQCIRSIEITVDHIVLVTLIT